MKNKKIKILIVDDHPALRTTMFDVLNEEGFETDYAQDGETGLNKCLENSYDFVLIDVQMPRMNGVEVFRKLKETKLIQLRQINYKFLIFDSDWPGSEQESLHTTIKSVKANTYAIETNEDEPDDLALKEINEYYHQEKVIDSQ